MKLAIDLPDADTSLLKAKASELGLTPEQFALALISDALKAPDERFRDAAARVLEKNAELYRRLS